jgi:hypothetical protein
MLGNIIGALIGKEVAERNRGGGFKGAVVGAATMSLIRRMGPLGLAVGGAYAARRMWKRSQAERRGTSDT